MAIPRFCIDTEFIEKMYGLEDVAVYTPELYAQGVNPNPLIDINYISRHYQIDDFASFIYFLQSNQGKPSKLFDTEYYLSQNTDVANSGVPAIFHFLSDGAVEQRKFSEKVDDYIQIRALLIGRGRTMKTISLLSLRKASFNDQWDDSFAKNYSSTLSSLNSTYNEPIDTFLSGNRIVIIGDLGLPQCKKYRVLQKVEYMRTQGVKAYYSHWLDAPRCMELLQKVSRVIFYRVPLCQIVLAYMEECNRLKVTTYYDLDDPLFDFKTYAENSNLQHLAKEETTSLLSNCNLYKQCMKYADYLIGSTPGICKLMSEKVGKDAFLWRNVVDQETLNALYYNEQVSTGLKKGDGFVIGYMSGSRAHEEDFACCFAAVTKFMYLRPSVRMVIVGHSESTKQLKKLFDDRIIQIPFQDYYSYLGNYEFIDLNLIPLVQNDFNECKSAIRYYEASLYKVPTIVSKVGDFVNVIDDNVNGLVIDNSTDNWYEALCRLMDMDTTQFAELGKAAESNIRSNYMIENFKIDSRLKEIFI